MDACNDTGSGFTELKECLGEYRSTPFNWEVLAPRVVDSPSMNFDNFGSSLFTLFQIVSQEGWTSLSWSAQMIVGKGKQPIAQSSPANAVFFVAYNLLGAVFVLTLFVSVFMRNYTEQTGVAFLTSEQRSWMELRKLLRQIRPSKRPPVSPNETWKSWCYRQATNKRGAWARFMTCILILHTGLLVVESYPAPELLDQVRGE
jgi:voltage-dependent calcium channel